ncbi:hypothetical protein Syun_014959 [Stephania yunnanensis]|uniref:Uncharacterized protein n=1 Tax=Stephania yunnanensis TaxID=152371 RepID=A0AAP0JKM9_9MAGN
MIADLLFARPAGRRLCIHRHKNNAAPSPQRPAATTVAFVIVARVRLPRALPSLLQIRPLKSRAAPRDHRHRCAASPALARHHHRCARRPCSARGALVLAGQFSLRDSARIARRPALALAPPRREASPASHARQARYMHGHPLRAKIRAARRHAIARPEPLAPSTARRSSATSPSLQVGSAPSQIELPLAATLRLVAVVQEVKGRVYGLGSQGYHRSISSGGASSSRGPTYGLHELEELQRDHQRLQGTLLKERMERQEKMQKDKMERQEETREMQDWLARMEGLLMQHLGIRPHVPLTPRTPPSPGTERSGPQNDDHPGHLTTEITPSQSGHSHDHRSRHLISLHRRMSEDQRHFWMIMMSLWSNLCRLRDHRHGKSDCMCNVGDGAVKKLERAERGGGRREAVSGDERVSGGRWEAEIQRGDERVSGGRREGRREIQRGDSRRCERREREEERTRE